MSTENPYQPVTCEAWEIVNGQRKEAYGAVRDSFGWIAAEWNLELGDQLKEPISRQQVARMMIRMKLRRDINKHSRDNAVDICGYAELMNVLSEPPTGPTASSPNPESPLPTSWDHR